MTQVVNMNSSTIQKKLSLFKDINLFSIKGAKYWCYINHVYLCFATYIVYRSALA